jgi:hypothetical protein
MMRFATLQDVPGIVAVLQQFAHEARVGFRSWRSSDTDRVAGIVAHWVRDHYVRVILVDNTVVGVLIAELGQDFWDPERRLLQERAWFVLPEYRHTRLSARLWQAWQQDTHHYLDQARVDAVLMSTQGPDTDFDVSSRGWRCIEQTWMREA